MIQEFVTDLAAQMGMKLSRVSVDEGREVGCMDAYLLKLSSGRQMVSALVFQSEMDNLQSGTACERLDTKIRAALSRLQLLLAP
jgi:hypothetical protein